MNKENRQALSWARGSIKVRIYSGKAVSSNRRLSFEVEIS